MKFTYNWLLDYLEPLPGVHILDKSLVLDGLLKLGLEVEYYNPLEDIKVAQIVKAEPHPNADKLQVCTVDAGTEKLTIVCGAKNAREGLKTLLVPVGKYLPALDMTIVKREVRGVASSGMLASYQELGLNAQIQSPDGIAELPEEAKVGTPAEEALENFDTVVEVSITPNLGHLLSVREIARSLARLGIAKFKDKLYTETTAVSLKNINQPVFANLSVNSAYSLGVTFVSIEGVDNSVKTPEKIAARLELIGQELISPVVDILNYYAVDLNHPMHVYDASKLVSGNKLLQDLECAIAKPSSMETSTGKHTFLALNGLKYDVTEQALSVIVDGKPAAVAGVIGSMETAVTTGTTSVVIECAHFDPSEVIKSTKLMKLNTDASYRFQRGVDPCDLEGSISEVVGCIVKYCGGTPQGFSTQHSLPVNQTTKHFTLDSSTISRILGWHVSAEQVAQALIGYGAGRGDIGSNNAKDLQSSNVTKQNIKALVCGEDIKVEVPYYRYDIECEQDLLAPIVANLNRNELERIDGYPNHLQHLSSAATTEGLTSFAALTQVRHYLASLGFLETVNMSFISEKLAKTFDIAESSFALENPISEQYAFMRRSLIPSLVYNALSDLKRGYASSKIFEIARCYQSTNAETLYIAGLISGFKESKTWEISSTHQLYQGAFEVKEVLLNLLANLGIKVHKLKIIPGSSMEDMIKPQGATEHLSTAVSPKSNGGLPSYYNPYRSAVIKQGNKVLGYFGEVNLMVLEQLNYKQDKVAIFELNVSNLPVLNALKPKARLEDNSLMPITQVLTFDVPFTTAADTITQAIFSAGKQQISEVALQDVYFAGASNSATEGTLQTTKYIALTFRILIVQTKALTAQDIENIRAAIVQKVLKTVPATKVRGITS